MKLPFSKTIKQALTTQKIIEQIKDWNFSKNRLKLIASEIGDWTQNYLPVNVEGLTVLDVGAGEGETAYFYLKHGAKKVYCIEQDFNLFQKLNSNQQNKALIALNKKFELKDLTDLKHDFLKMDIEGYEEELLNTELKTPAVIEVHGLQLRDKFQKKGYRIKHTRPNTCTTYAYWKC